MLKARLLCFFRTLWQSCAQSAGSKPQQDDVSRLKRHNERNGEKVHLGPDIHASLRDLQARTTRGYIHTQKEEQPLESLGHWCGDQNQQKKIKPVPIEQRANKKHTFEIDPCLPANCDSLQFDLAPSAMEESRPTLSDAARREIMRIETLKHGQISRSLSSFAKDESPDHDAELAENWNCTEYNSLFALPDESRYGTTTEYEEDFEEDLLPYFTETLLQQEEELAYDDFQEADLPQIVTASQEITSEIALPQPAAAPSQKLPEPKTKVSKQEIQVSQPYKNFSENALKLIAQKPETPAPTLKWLASHANPHIRAAVAKNPSTPGDTVIILAKDHEAGIRHSIAENPQSCIEALNLLVKDRNPLIAWRAQNTVTQIKEATRDQTNAQQRALAQAQAELEQQSIREAKIATTEETIAFLQVIARKTNTPARRLEELARHYDVRIRAAVAENANASPDILWLLSKDVDSGVKVKVTDNYNCPTEILEALKEDEDAFVAYQAHTVLMRIIGGTFADSNHIRTGTWP